MAASTRSKPFVPDAPSEGQLFQLAKNQLQRKGYLLLKNVPKDVALSLIERLDSDSGIGSEGKYRYNYEKDTLIAFMPTKIHDSVQCAIQDILEHMVDTNFLSWNQFKKLKIKVGTTYDEFIDPHAGTVKQADLELKVDGRQTPWIPSECPIWVNESGWSETRPALDRDISKWLAGTGYGVLVAIQTKFTLRQNSRVAGYVIFHTNDGTTIKRKEIFPAPPNPVDDQITYARKDLFGDTLPLELGQTPGDIYILDVSILRRRAAAEAQKMALTLV